MVRPLHEETPTRGHLASEVAGTGGSRSRPRIVHPAHLFVLKPLDLVSGSLPTATVDALDVARQHCAADEERRMGPAYDRPPGKRPNLQVRGPGSGHGGPPTLGQRLRRFLVLVVVVGLLVAAAIYLR